jgi:hypothetical protein
VKLTRNETVLIILFVIAPLYTIAQDSQSSHIQEVGINFSNLNSFGIRYKCGNDTTLLRFTLLSLNGSNNRVKPDSLGNHASSTGFGFNIGFEKRKNITEKLGYYYGLDLLTSYSNNHISSYGTSINDVWTVSGGIGVVLGLNFKISNNIYLAAEVLPSIRVTYGKDKFTNNGIALTRNTIIDYSYGLSNSGASLTLSYRF